MPLPLSSFCITVNDLSQTQSLGHLLGSNCTGGEVFFLSGELGAGKTTFSQAIAEGLGVKVVVNSPTFVLAKDYLIPGKNFQLIHADMYRTGTIEDLVSIGIIENLEVGSDIVIIEWPDRQKSLENYPHIHIEIDRISNTRVLTFSLHGEKDQLSKLYKRVYDQYIIS